MKENCEKENCGTNLISKAEKQRGVCDFCKLKKSRIGGQIKDEPTNEER